jgi:putative intracellular protease/amidase
MTAKWVCGILVVGLASTAWAEPAGDKSTRTLGVVLYEGFELLDVFGPAEVFGSLGGKVKLVMVAEEAGPVKSAQGPTVLADVGFKDCPRLDLVLVPGGIGTLSELRNETLLTWIRERGDDAEIVMSVCSGSAILAKAGILDGRRATSNKRFFRLATAQSDKVEWIKEARWVDDGTRVTSSGVTAGVDMSLAVVGRLYGEEVAVKTAEGIEHIWSRDASHDPFAAMAK